MYVFLYVRNGSIVTDFNVIVALSSEEEAHRDLAKIYRQLLTDVVKVPYNGQNYSVEEVTITSRNGQNTSNEQCLIVFKIIIAEINYQIILKD